MNFYSRLNIKKFLTRILQTAKFFICRLTTSIYFSKPTMLYQKIIKNLLELLACLHIYSVLAKSPHLKYGVQSRRHFYNLDSLLKFRDGRASLNDFGHAQSLKNPGEKG